MKFIIAIVVLFSLSIKPANAGNICREASSKTRLFSKRPNLPKKLTARTNEIAGFCKANPHGFGFTSVSPLPSEKSYQCYAFKENGLVIELPNFLFCEGWSDKRIDILVQSYTVSLANYYKSGFELVLYNKGQWVYRQLVIDRKHPVYDYLRYTTIVGKRMRYILERITSYPSDMGIVGCFTSNKAFNGKDCPKDIAENGAKLTADLLNFKKPFQIPFINHTKYE